MLHCCVYSEDYCVGSLVKWKAPVVVRKKVNADINADIKGSLHRIKLESSDSKTNYAIINVSSNERISLKLKIRKKEKIQYLLQDYGCNIQQQQDFRVRCCSLLVSCIDFITPRSKRARVKPKYVRQPSWESFLRFGTVAGLGQQRGIEVINWSISRISNNLKKVM